ncbi:hypothetical protein JB92DRAFT_3125092 [Gautieria morchelliformis]|nr:hypothetical protein JB92DRAFT_3125092 [Gautieria morchelliformis]
MSGISNNSRPKRKITATEKVVNPSNASTPALASHQAAATAAAAKRLAAAKLPSARSPECIGGRGVEEGSVNIAHTGETTDHTENAFGGDVSKKFAAGNSSCAGNSSSRVNKLKTLDTVYLTNSEFAADRGENSMSDSTGSTKTHHKEKKKHGNYALTQVGNRSHRRQII